MPPKTSRSFKLGEVEPGAEMVAVAGQTTARISSGSVEERRHALYDRVVQRVAFLRPMQPQHGDCSAPLGAKRSGKNAKISGAIVQGKLAKVDGQSALQSGLPCPRKRVKARRNGAGVTVI